MAVNGPISAKNYRDIGLFEERRPFGPGKALKLGQRSRHVSRPEDGSGAHAQELDHTAA